MQDRELVQKYSMEKRKFEQISKDCRESPLPQRAFEALRPSTMVDKRNAELVVHILEDLAASGNKHK